MVTYITAFLDGENKMVIKNNYPIINVTDNSFTTSTKCAPGMYVSSVLCPKIWREKMWNFEKSHCLLQIRKWLKLTFFKILSNEVVCVEWRIFKKKITMILVFVVTIDFSNYFYSAFWNLYFETLTAIWQKSFAKNTQC